MSVWGRLAAGHVDPADDPYHEQDLDPGGTGHEDGLVQVLLYRPRPRFVLYLYFVMHNRIVRFESLSVGCPADWPVPPADQVWWR